MWPRDPNHHWHQKESLKTTICFLTLAQQHTPEKHYERNDFENEGFESCIKSAQAIFVRRPKTKTTADATKRFPRALNTLGLTPYLHPSQRNAVVMPGHGDTFVWPSTSDVPAAAASTGKLQ